MDTVPSPQNINSTKFATILTKCFAKNPFLTLFNFGLTIGGVFASIFFIQLGYFPDLDLQNVAALLIAIAITGIFITLIFISFLILPHYFLGDIWISNFQGSTEQEASNQLQAQEQKISKERKLWFFFTSVSYSLLGFAVLMLLSSKFASGKNLSPEFIWVPILVAVFFTILADPSKAKIETHIHFFFVWLAAWIPLFILMVLLNFSGDDQWSNFLLFFVLVIVLNTLLAAWKRDDSYFVVLVAIATIFLVALPHGQFSLVKRTFSLLHLGEIEQATIAVSKTTCERVNQLRPTSCEVDGERGTITKAKIKSRIGKEYLLDFGSATSSDTKQTITTRISLGKDQVLGWSYQAIESNSPSK